MKKIIASLIMLANIPTVFAYQPEQFSLTINGNNPVVTIFNQSSWGNIPNSVSANSGSSVTYGPAGFSDENQSDSSSDYVQFQIIQGANTQYLTIFNNSGYAPFVVLSNDSNISDYINYATQYTTFAATNPVTGANYFTVDLSPDGGSATFSVNDQVLGNLFATCYLNNPVCVNSKNYMDLKSPNGAVEKFF